MESLHSNSRGDRAILIGNVGLERRRRTQVIELYSVAMSCLERSCISSILAAILASSIILILLAPAEPVHCSFVYFLPPLLFHFLRYPDLALAIH